MSYIQDFLPDLFSRLTYLGQAKDALGGSNVIQLVVMTVGLIAIFYFLMIRPQQKKQKDLKKQIEGLTKGDRFVTVGGLYATVIGIKEDKVIARIAEDVKVEFSKSAVHQVLVKGSE